MSTAPSRRKLGVVRPDAERPVYSEEHEKLLISAILVDPAVLDEVRGTIGRQSFFLDRYGVMFDHLARLRDAGQPIEPLSLADALGVDPTNDRPGPGGITKTDIEDVAAANGLPGSAMFYAGRIAELSLGRRARLAADELVQQLQRRDATVAEVMAEFIGRAQQFIDEDRATSGRRWTVPAEEVAEDVTRWLWRRHIPLGNLTMFAGDGGLGKTAAAVGIGAQVTRGAPFWTTDDVPEGPRHVLYVSAEDDNATDLKPRFRRAGARMDHLHFATVDLVGALRLSNPAQLVEAIDEIGPELALVIIDPPTAFLDGDNNSTTDVRAATTALKAIASERQISIVLINHFNKGQSNTARGKLLGSQAWRNACRAVWVFAPDPDQAENEVDYDEDWRPRPVAPTTRYIMAPDKITAALMPPAIRYCLDADGPEAPVAWTFLGTCETSADELVREQEPMRRRDDRDLDDAAEWLAGQLADGPRPSKSPSGQEIWQEGNEACGLQRSDKWWRTSVLKQRLGGRTGIARGIRAGQWFWCAKGQAPPLITTTGENIASESSDS